jgi:hopanoid biosynthesis associated RND transporter like protein HpnN
MLTSLVVRIIDFCTRRAWTVVAVGLMVTLAAVVYSARNFAINSDINALLSPNLDWRKRELAFDKAFSRYDLIVVLVEAPTPELTAEATSTLARALAQHTQQFRTVTQPAGGEFFARYGLLFQSPEEIGRELTVLSEAQPLLRALVSDQSLRGLARTLRTSLLALESGRAKLDDFARLFNAASETVENVVAGKQASFSWRGLLHGPPSREELRGFIEVRPVLDFGALEPGHAATSLIRKLASDIAPGFQARVRLTGPVPMADEEFATLKEGAEINGLITIIVVLGILWLALRSAGLIAGVFIAMFAGLAVTAALGLMMVGALNLISVSFAVLFVGIGVDFGIQYSVRYRAERHENDDLTGAIRQAGRYVGRPLTLAATATAAGFLSFLPTDYRGVSELGLIAGVGMLVALVTSITLLPALIRLFNPAGEPEPLGYKSLAPVDTFLDRHRVPIIVGTALVVLAGMPLLYWLRFDFNPINLRSVNAESIATYLDLSRDPAANTNAVGVLAPSLAAADGIAARLSKVPEVARAMTLSSFIPERQDEKLPLIRNAAGALAPAFDPKNAQPPPSDRQNIAALTETARQLTEVAEGQQGAGAAGARRLSGALTALAAANEEVRTKAAETFLAPLRLALSGLQASLQAEPVTLESLPPELRRDWVTPEGQARVLAAPKGDPGDNEAMRRFARAVLAVEPTATDGPISVLEAGRTVVRAFAEAALWALLSIAVLLWIVLRRFGDVLLTLIPLVLAGVVTMQVCVLIGMPLNFANIIALPLLLGVGVAFKIYYIMAWRAGQTNLLQTSLTRAVIYSALTTATAFGSLWFSSHPGTSSMGKLLALSLVCTLAAAVLFQPVLMGKPRNIAAAEAA